MHTVCKSLGTRHTGRCLNRRVMKSFTTYLDDVASSESSVDVQESGLVPKDHVRLTVNIRANLHQKLKARSVKDHTTIGQMIEDWARTL